jgi:hypothetical protein
VLIQLESIISSISENLVALTVSALWGHASYSNRSIIL